MRYLLLLVISVSAGYAIGFRDGREHDKMIVARIVDHIQNANQGTMSTDADKKLDDIERH